VIAIRGTAAGRDFSHYELSVQREGDDAWRSLGSRVYTPVHDGELGRWPRSARGTGWNLLRLAVTTTDGRIWTDVVSAATPASPSPSALRSAGAAAVPVNQVELARKTAPATLASARSASRAEGCIARQGSRNAQRREATADALSACPQTGWANARWTRCGRAGPGAAPGCREASTVGRRSTRGRPALPRATRPRAASTP